MTKTKSVYQEALASLGPYRKQARTFDPATCQDCGLTETIDGEVPVDMFENPDRGERFLCLGDLSTRQWHGQTWRRIEGWVPLPDRYHRRGGSV